MSKPIVPLPLKDLVTNSLDLIERLKLYDEQLHEKLHIHCTY